MNQFSSQQKIIGAIIALGAALIGIFTFGFGGNTKPIFNTTRSPQSTQPTLVISRDKPQVVSTNPGSLNGAIILPNQTLEISFSEPAVNAPELKVTLEPPTDVKMDLSEDRKTLKITPNKPYQLGQEYTLIIKQEAKFDSKKQFEGDVIFHFKTISYNGV